MGVMTAAAAFSVHPTPIGEALVVVTDAGLATLELLDIRRDASAIARERVARMLDLVPEEDASATAAVTDQLDEYFAGTRHAFEIDLDLSRETAFLRRALEAVCTIPYGEVWSYAEVAIAAGSPRAHRAIGTACARTPISIVVPAHRVVRSDGSIGEYGGHPERKRYLLDLEAQTLDAHVLRA